MRKRTPETSAFGEKMTELAQIGIGNPMGGLLILIGIAAVFFSAIATCAWGASLAKRRHYGSIPVLFLGISLLSGVSWFFLSLRPDPPTPYRFDIHLDRKHDLSWVPSDETHPYSQWIKDGFCPISGKITARIFVAEEIVATEYSDEILLKTDGSRLTSIWFSEDGFYPRNQLFSRIDTKLTDLGVESELISSERQKIEERIDTYEKANERDLAHMTRWHFMEFDQGDYIYQIRVHRSFGFDNLYTLRHYYITKANQAVDTTPVSAPR